MNFNPFESRLTWASERFWVERFFMYFSFARLWVRQHFSCAFFLRSFRLWFFVLDFICRCCGGLVLCSEKRQLYCSTSLFTAFCISYIICFISVFCFWITSRSWAFGVLVVGLLQVVFLETVLLGAWFDLFIVERFASCFSNRRWWNFERARTKPCSALCLIALISDLNSSSGGMFARAAYCSDFGHVLFSRCLLSLLMESLLFAIFVSRETVSLCFLLRLVLAVALWLFGALGVMARFCMASIWLLGKRISSSIISSLSLVRYSGVLGTSAGHRTVSASARSRLICCWSSVVSFISAVWWLAGRVLWSSSKTAVSILCESRQLLFCDKFSLRQ